MDDSELQNDFNIVFYQRVYCPKCDCLHCPVTNTQPEIDGKIIRHHKCQDCGHCFKSIEILKKEKE